MWNYYRGRGGEEGRGEEGGGRGGRQMEHLGRCVPAKGGRQQRWGQICNQISDHSDNGPFRVSVLWSGEDPSRLLIPGCCNTSPCRRDVWTERAERVFGFGLEIVHSSALVCLSDLQKAQIFSSKVLKIFLMCVLNADMLVLNERARRPFQSIVQNREDQKL